MTPAYTYRAELVRVIDGDTIVVDLDLGLGIWVRKQYLRLYGINTPELRGDDREAGHRAKLFAIEKLHGAHKLVVQTHKGDSKGKYGRWLATVWCLDFDGNWLNLNEELVVTSHAKRIE